MLSRQQVASAGQIVQVGAHVFRTACKFRCVTASEGMLKRQSGFTLIELMIVVTIIAILTTIAVPSYQDYTKRARVSETLLALSQCRTEVTHYMQINSTLPTIANQYGCEKLT